MVPVLQVLHRLNQKQNYLTRKVSLHPSPHPHQHPQLLAKIVSSLISNRLCKRTTSFSWSQLHSHINDEDGNHFQQTLSWCFKSSLVLVRAHFVHTAHYSCRIPPGYHVLVLKRYFASIKELCWGLSAITASKFDILLLVSIFFFYFSLSRLCGFDSWWIIFHDMGNLCVLCKT